MNGMFSSIKTGLQLSSPLEHSTESPSQNTKGKEKTFKKDMQDRKEENKLFLLQVT